eukprot:509160-Rhodomonas_salina.2
MREVEDCTRQSCGKDGESCRKDRESWGKWRGTLDQGSHSQGSPKSCGMHPKVEESTRKEEDSTRKVAEKTGKVAEKTGKVEENLGARLALPGLPALLPLKAWAAHTRCQYRPWRRTRVAAYARSVPLSSAHCVAAYATPVQHVA